LQSIEKEEGNEAEAECDLILVDKQAWLAAERMKVAKDAESSEYDSDDTMIKKSKLDAARANSDNKILNIIKEEILIDEEIDVFPIETKKLYKTSEKKSEKEVNSLIVYGEDDVSSNGMDKSSNDTKISNSDQNNDCFVYKLNKSEQVANITRRVSETHHESDEDENDDTDKLNKSSRINKTNISQQKSLQERKSLNKSSKNTSLKENDNNTQDFFINEYQTNDILQEESDRMEISRKKSLSSKDDNEIEEQSCLDRSIEKSKVIRSIKLMNVSDKESDSDSDTIIQVMDLESQNYSTIAHAGSLADDAETSDSIIVPDYLFTDDDDIHNNSDKDSDNDNDSHNNTDKDSDIDSDVRKEYNLDGMEQKFDDDNVPHDECRASESEYSDSDDNGSDLADFIVDDNEVETEEEKEEDSDEEQEENDEEQEMDEEQEEMDDEDKQSEEEDNENRKKDNKIDKKRKNQSAKKDHKKVDEYVLNEDDADNEQSEIEICPYNDSDKSNDEDESVIIGENKKSNSIEIISSRVNKAKKKQVAETRKNERTVLLDESNPDVLNENIKPCVAQNEKILLVSSESPVKIKRKSFLRNSEKIEMEQDSSKQLDESTGRFSRKLLKLHTSMKCSTPKLNSSKYVLELDIETPKILKEAQESKNKLYDENKTMQNTSSKIIKSKNSTIKRDISLTDISHQDKYFVKKPLNISLPSDLMENVRKANRSKPIISKITELYKTISISHTETPTIRELRKEKLNETAPASKLYPEIDQSKELSIEKIEKKEDIAEIKMKNNEDIATNIQTSLEPSNDDIMQKRKKKRKRQTEETLKENIIDKALSEDNVELQILQKKKPLKLSESLNTKDSESTPQINEERKKKKKTKKKKKQADTNEQNEYIKKADIDQKDRNETVLVEHKKNKIEIASNAKSKAFKNNHTNIEKKSEQKEQEITQSEKTLPEKSSRKKRKRKQKEEKETAPLEIKASEENSKNSNLDKPRSQITGSTIQQETIASRNAAFTKARREVQEAIHAAEMRIRANRELKKKKMREEIIEKENRERALQIQKQNLQEQNTKSLSKKRKKETSESRAFPSSSTSGLKRLPDDVIKNLSDMPKAVKKRKLLQNENPNASPPKRSKSMNAKNNIVLSTSGGTTQFAVINIQKFKDQPPKELNVVTSFRERMFNRNKREPISAYLMYLEKQRASSKNNKRSKLF